MIFKFINLGTPFKKWVMSIAYYDTSKNTTIWAILDAKNKRYWDVRIFHSLKCIKIVFQLYVFTNRNQVNIHEACPLYVAVCYFRSWTFVFYYWSDTPINCSSTVRQCLKFGGDESVSPKLQSLQWLENYHNIRSSRKHINSISKTLISYF